MWWPVRGSKPDKEPGLKLPKFLDVPWTLSDLTLLVAAWFGAQILLVVLLNQLSPAVPAFGQFMQAVMDGNVAAAFAYNLIDAAIGLGLVAVVLRKYKVRWSALGWRRVSVRRTVLYLLGILVVFVVAVNVVLMLVSALVPGFNPDQAQSNEFTRATGSDQNLALVALVLLPPVLEETIFRGFVFPAIAKRAGVVWGAVLSSVIFGVAHWQANVGIYTFLLGLLLCFMYVRLRSIVPGMLLHMVNNFMAFLALAK